MGCAWPRIKNSRRIQMQNHIRPFELAKKIEDYILWKLARNHIEARKNNKPEHDIHEKRVDVYNHFTKLSELERKTEYVAGDYQYQILTAGFFNRVVDDMKRAGLIGTAKGGSIIYLTEESRKEWIDSEKTCSDAVKAGA
jgi:hypothetical protein